MVTTPSKTKRYASGSPEGERVAKRPAPSSPEEGELDDPSPPPPPPPREAPPQLPSFLPPKPTMAKTKIPFPFKKKGTREKERETESRRWSSRGVDHWEPSYSLHHHDKHRLPPPRSPEPAFSPPQRRDHDRFGDRHRNDTWRPRDDDGDRRYRSGRLDDTDRYYRPRDGREWTRRDDEWPRRDEDRRGDRRREYSRDAERTRYVDSYRPVSPGPLAFSRPTSATPRPPNATRPPSPNEAAPPPPTPPPPEMTPPPPPPLESAHHKDQTLPNAHATVSIAMKRPPPRERSPPHISLTSVPSTKLPPPPPPPEQQGTKSKLRPPDVPKVKPVRKRQIMRRTVKQEIDAYGREFFGCGHQADYDLTTKLGEGTFGEVHKAINKKTGVVVALKRILMHNEKEGMPVTALREIKILKALKHPCIVDILDMFVVRSTEKDPLSVYMVFPYMDHDLAGLLENERVKLQPSHIKLYMKQLLEGTEYMHRNHILHRDMKAANLLISNSGSLKIADLGLARSFDHNVTRGGLDPRGRERKYTNCVVTRWYRPPELLLGARQYGGEVDIWGIGCVLGEMFSRRPILPGTSDLDQLEKIWQLCGTPNQHTWPNHDTLPGCEGVTRFPTHYARRVKQAYESVGAETADLLDKLLVCNPRERITAAQALEHDYFWTDPLPADPKSLPVYEASHEFDKRAHRNHHPPPNPIPIPNMPNMPNMPNPNPPFNPQAGPPVHFNRGGPPAPQPPNFYPGGPPPPAPNPHHHHHHHPSYPPPPPGHVPGPGFVPPPPPHTHGFMPGRGPPGPYPPPPGMHHHNHINHHNSRGGSGRPGAGSGGGYRGGGNRADQRHHNEPPKSTLPRPAHLPPKPMMPQGALPNERPGPPGGHRGGGGANVQLNYD
ncbi:putative cyclin-dependent kinase 9 [Leucoagaricus sp. SymC.cos]|nr:putative cyclin-dependent kinase 9 [Leucoagaricus sp. SymC.cos]